MLRKMLTIFFISFIMILSCIAKKKPTRFAQGLGKNLNTISEYENSSFTLTTGDPILDEQAKFPNVKVTRFESFIVKEDTEGINNFPLVEYKSDSKLIPEDIPIRARPHHQYKILYKISNKLLTLYKVGPKKDIPFQEYSRAMTLSDGSLAVPIVGYPISSFINLEKIKNADNDDTNLIMELSENEPSKATHFRFNISDYQLFSSPEKVDIYPFDYFDDQWKLSFTIVDQSNVINLEECSIESLPGVKHISGVKFQKFESYLKGEGALEIINGNDHETQKASLALPVKWKSYLVPSKGENRSLEEKEISESHYSSSPYVEVSFDGIKLNIIESKKSEEDSNSGFGIRKMNHLFFSNNCFSFSILDVDLNKKNIFLFRKQ